jgi:hypothetical protein
VKLDARDKQRLQWGVMILIGGVAVMYACTQLVIFPLRHTREEGMNRMSALHYVENWKRYANDMKPL